MAEATLRRKPETIWKLVDARCAQLTDAVVATRTPFLLALAWSFVMAWQIYVGDFGYVRLLRELNIERTIKLGVGTKAEIATACRQSVRGFAMSENDPSNVFQRKKSLCADILKERLGWYETTYLDSKMIAFPGGFSKLSESDVATVGQAGLLLILVWGFYAMRRENHAIREFVDQPDHRTFRNIAGRQFALVPQDRNLSAEHLAYAYNSVSQRFLFLFSRYSRPLLAITVLLCALPAIVAAWNASGDALTIFQDAPAQVASDFMAMLRVRLSIEFVLLLAIITVTVETLGHVFNTSLLLNAWHLAVRDVWMEEWDETTQTPASPVIVDMVEQTAVRKVS